MIWKKKKKLFTLQKLILHARIIQYFMKIVQLIKVVQVELSLILLFQLKSFETRKFANISVLLILNLLFSYFILLCVDSVLFHILTFQFAVLKLKWFPDLNKFFYFVQKKKKKNWEELHEVSHQKDECHLIGFIFEFSQHWIILYYNHIFGYFIQ